MKTRPLKILQPVRAVPYLPNRSALPKPDVLFLMRLRKGMDLPRSRQVIPVAVRGGQENHAQTVKITHR